MRPQIIFETKRLVVTKLLMSDLGPFHEMQSDLSVMQYVRGTGMTLEENEKELPELIEKYDKNYNDFWIYAIRRKSDLMFVGTCALVKDGQGDDELGYRFLKHHWGLGYGFEVCQGLVDYCRSMKLPKLVGYVVDVNIASAKILEKCGFQMIKKGIEPNLKLPETKYELIL